MRYNNKYGEIASGTAVYFEMENSSGGGDRQGILTYEADQKRWVIKTERSGLIEIGDLQAYPDSIQPVQRLKR